MSDFYRDQNVVVLGGAGFVGRHLCRLLTERGAIVSVIDNLSRHESQLTYVISKIYKLDIHSFSAQHFSAFENVMRSIAPFAVFNLAAAVAGVEYNQKHHNQMFLDNVQLQTVPVMVCEQLNIPHFLQVSSACVYGEDANAPAVEDNLGGEPVGANAGYSWAKRMGERAVQWSNLKHAVIVRPSNIYGPGDWYDERAHVIPKLIKGYDQGTAKIFGSGTSVRQFIYVDDAAKGMIHALEHGGNKEAYNLSPCDWGSAELQHHSILAVHDIISTIMGKELAPEVKATFDPGDDQRYSDVSKLYNLGWYQETSFLSGLKKTIEAYLETK